MATNFFLRTRKVIVYMTYILRIYDKYNKNTSRILEVYSVYTSSIREIQIVSTIRVNESLARDNTGFAITRDLHRDLQ